MLGRCARMLELKHCTSSAASVVTVYMVIPTARPHAVDRRPRNSATPRLGTFIVDIHNRLKALPTDD